MASCLRIVDINGKVLNLIKGEGQTWAEVIELAHLPRRFAFCLRNWLSDDPSDTSAEDRVKAYLDRIGYILTRDEPDDKIITDYRILRDRVALIPASGVPEFENLLYSNCEDNRDDDILIPSVKDEDEMTVTEREVFASLTSPRRIPKEIQRIHEQNKKINAMFERYPG